MQLLGGGRYVKSTLGDGRQVAQLMQLHAMRSLLRPFRTMWATPL
jgi:hypothetical protein